MVHSRLHPRGPAGQHHRRAAGPGPPAPIPSQGPRPVPGRPYGRLRLSPSGSAGPGTRPPAPPAGPGAGQGGRHGGTGGLRVLQDAEGLVGGVEEGDGGRDAHGRQAGGDQALLNESRGQQHKQSDRLAQQPAPEDAQARALLQKGVQDPDQDVQGHEREQQGEGGGGQGLAQQGAGPRRPATCAGARRERGCSCRGRTGPGHSLEVPVGQDRGTMYPAGSAVRQADLPPDGGAGMARQNGIGGGIAAAQGGEDGMPGAGPGAHAQAGRGGGAEHQVRRCGGQGRHGRGQGWRVVLPGLHMARSERSCRRWAGVMGRPSWCALCGKLPCITPFIV